MPIYNVIRKTDGLRVYSYTSDAPVDFPQLPFADFYHVEEPSLPEPTPRRRVTKLEFIGLLGDDYRTILAASKQSIDVEMFVKMLELATPEQDGTSIDLDDSRTRYGLSQLEAAGVIGVGRTVEILS